MIDSSLSLPSLFSLSQDEVVSRLLLPAKNFASVELEVLRDSAELASSVSFVEDKQLAVVISAPRCFIDRTGLGFIPVKDSLRYPVFDNKVILLGDSTVRPHKIHISLGTWRIYPSPCMSVFLPVYAVSTGKEVRMFPAYACLYACECTPASQPLSTPHGGRSSTGTGRFSWDAVAAHAFVFFVRVGVGRELRLLQVRLQYFSGDSGSLPAYT